MDIHQLKAFIEVARRASFSAASRALYCSQSAVSAQIKQLEQEYGTPLLDRRGRTVSLTPKGEVVLEYAQRIISLLRESHKSIADMDGNIGGIVRIGANESTFTHILREPLIDFLRENPGIQLVIQRYTSAEIIEMVEQNVIDLGVVTLPVTSPTLAVKELLCDPIVAIVPADHPISAVAGVSLVELLAYPFILLSTGRVRRHLDKLFEDRGIKPDVRLEVPSMMMANSFAASGLGVTIGSRSVAREYTQTKKLVCLPLTDAEFVRKLGIIYLKSLTLSRTTNHIIDFLQMHLSMLTPFESAPAASIF